MTTLSGGPGRGRYLISCNDGVKLARFVDDARIKPELTLLDTIGPRGAPYTAVFEMAHSTAADLARDFALSGDMKIEPDRPLSMFGPSL